MTKRKHKKYLDRVHIDPENPDCCTLKIKCPCINQISCNGCWYHKTEEKKRRKLKDEYKFYK